jgi:NhaP-type Na+/H+ or K+/H+ antiporter
MTAAIVVLALIFLYSLASRRLALWNVSAPMVFVTAGILLGEDVLGLVEMNFSEELTLLVAEVALVILLFIDAQRIDVSQIRSLPGRLLGIGLPLTIIAGAAAALLLLTDLEFWEATLIAVILAPTDASLGSAVVSNPRVPVRIRQALNVESGLNDGIAVPVLFLFLALAGAEEAGSASFWTEFALKQIGFGIVAGIAIGAAGGWLAREAVRRDWAAAKFRQLAVPALALLAWAAAGEIGGSGFIAAFVAGIAVGQIYAEPAERDLDFAIDIGEALSLVVFFIFGAVLVLDAFGDLTWQIALYAVLSLTLVRMLPVAISMIGKDLDRASVGFLGWFGPRGLASIILVLVILEEEADLAGFDLLVTVMAVTVTLSVFAHGITAGPLSRRYGKHAEDLDESEAALEETHEDPVRAPGRRPAAAALDEKDRSPHEQDYPDEI